MNLNDAIELSKVCDTSTHVRAVSNEYLFRERHAYLKIGDPDEPLVQEFFAESEIEKQMERVHHKVFADNARPRLMYHPTPNELARSDWHILVVVPLASVELKKD